MSSKNYQHKLTTNEHGIVSIVVVMVVMGILVLMTTSFALLMRREQRQVLDRQLSTQAFYAAESGVNDAIEKLKGSGISGDIKTCDTSDQNKISSATDRQIGDATVTYSCVLVDQSPDSLVYGSLSKDSSTIIHLRAASGNIDRVQISWEDADGGTLFVPATSPGELLPQKDTVSPNTNPLIAAGATPATTGTGMVRATLMPIRGAVSRDSLVGAAATYFLYPRASATPRLVGNEPYAANPGSGDFINGQCNTASKPTYPRACTAEITGLSGLGTGDMYLRLKSIYRPAAVTVKIFTTSGPTDIEGAQAVIDSTGKARDVLRRIQVRVPIDNTYRFPEFAIESMDTLCKRMFLYPGGADIDLPTAGVNSGQIDYDSNVDDEVCDPEIR